MNPFTILPLMLNPLISHLLKPLPELGPNDPDHVPPEIPFAFSAFRVSQRDAKSISGMAARGDNRRNPIGQVCRHCGPSPMISSLYLGVQRFRLDLSWPDV